MVPRGGRQNSCLMGVKFQIEVPTLTMYNHMILVLSADQRSLLAYVKTGKRTRERFFSFLFLSSVKAVSHKNGFEKQKR
jgi:hypothetical protein